MAKKYHVSDETGVPGVCTAEPGKCPVNRGAGDDETEHYSSPTAAMKGFENRNVGSEVPVASKKAKSEKSPEMLLLEKRRANMASIIEDFDVKKVSLAEDSFGNLPVSDFSVGEIATFVNSFNKIDKIQKSAEREMQEIGREIQNLEDADVFDSNMSEEVIARHADKGILKQIRKKNATLPKYKQERFGIERDFEFNPSRFSSPDSDSDFLTKGSVSALIIAGENGENPYAMYSGLENLKTPKSSLGNPATVVTQNDDTMTQAQLDDRKGIIVGYVSLNGVRHGYVPDEEIPVYICK